MDRAEIAVALKRAGCNCCQAVVLAFKDLLDLDEGTLRRVSSAFGGGMGRYQATCGALCGAQIVLGLLRYEGEPLRDESHAILTDFEKMAGAIKCDDLKGVSSGHPICPCEDCVRHAVVAASRVAIPHDET